MKISYFLVVPLACMICVLLCISSSAQDWERTIGQFQHTSWDSKAGAPGLIRALAQTEDGYLWLGTDDGLYRFDGVSFERYEPRSGGPLPSSPVSALWSDGRGDLWIGFRSGGISLLQDGSLKNYTAQDGAPSGRVRSFIDREGTIWVSSEGGLARLDGAQWKKIGHDWNFPGSSAQALFLDRQGTLWIATEDTVVFLPSRAKLFQPTGIRVGQVFQIAQAANGKLWMAETTRSVRPIPLGGQLRPSDETEIRVGSVGILFDPEGALWITTLGDGLRYAPHPERLSGKPGRFSHLVENFTTKDGLTDDLVHPILADREGNIWVGTHNGLDCFRKSNLVPVAMPVPLRQSVIAAGEGGDIWVEGINLSVRVHGGHADARSARIQGDQNTDMNNHDIIAAYRDPAGTIWWLGVRALHRFKHGRLTQFPLPEQLLLQVRGVLAPQLAEDRSGVIWVAAPNSGLFCMKNDTWKRFETPPPLAGLNPRAAYSDWRGRVWFGYDHGTIIVIDNDKIQTLSSDRYSPVGEVRAINGRDQHIWVGGDLGLAFFDGSRFLPVIPADAPSFGKVLGIEETSDGSLWLAEAGGVVHISGNEVQWFLRDPVHRVQYVGFDSLDGLPGTFQDPDNSKETQGTDGRLWFVASNGLAWLDPARISRNLLPPPVAILSVSADGKSYPYRTNVELPALTTNLQIQFTALSLSIPKRVRFRYKLEGYDKDWTNAGTRREAWYTNLGPHKYRFRVIACNNDGVWNEVGSFLDFSISPAYYQTNWFRALCASAFLALLWMLYQLRVRQLRQKFALVVDARVNERTRIARELHDTLLQSFQGLLMSFQRVANLLPDRPTEAKERLEGAIDQAAQAVTESRDAVQGLRSSMVLTNELAVAIRTLGEELAAKQTSENSPLFSVAVEGTPCDLNPILRDDVYRIAGEALRNAFQHAQARRIEAELRYDERRFGLRIRDDGKGIAKDVFQNKGRSGHWGLQGMRERAKLVGGHMEIWSEVDSGTEIELSIPASAAYASAPGHSRKRTVV